MDRARLQTQYEQKVRPALQKELALANVHMVPRLEKVVLNVGVGRAAQDPKALEQAVATLERITGQHPIITKSKKSISNFKIRKGMPVGVKVTLRSRRMYEFIDKLINISLPRVRDFQGVPLTAFDAQGNYTVAFREHNVFPEISGESAEKLHGLEVTITTTARNRVGAEALLRSIGFPFQKKTS